MRAVGYARVSSQEQVDGTSLKSQVDQLRGYATLRGMDLVDILVDAGVSGGMPIAERPAGAALEGMIQAGEVQCVIVLKLDRAFRNTVDCL
ncbi:recombinase family protein, partial [Candidatus Magnetobacterium casense]